MARLCVITFVIFAVAATAFAGDGKIRKQLRRVPDVYLVQFEPSVKDSHGVAHDLVKRYGGDVDAVLRNTIPGMILRGTEAEARAISADSRVLRVEEAAWIEPAGNAPVNPPTGPGWALDRITQHNLPLDGSSTFAGQKGVGTMIYIVDSGVNDPLGTEFGSRLRHMWSAYTSFADGYGHGTRVAALAGGATRGVATSAQIVNVRIMNNFGQGASSNLPLAIGAINADFEAINPSTGGYSKPAIVNMSLAFSASDIIDDAVRDSMRRGISYVVGAGNNGADASAYSPARLGKPNSSTNPYPEHTVTVGATRLDAPWDFDYVMDDLANGLASNTGTVIDIWAPGYRVHTIHHTTGAVIEWSGTSAATPLVAGAMARYSYSDLGMAIGFDKPNKWEVWLVSQSTSNLIYGNLGGAANKLLWLYGSPN